MRAAKQRGGCDCSVAELPLTVACDYGPVTGTVMGSASEVWCHKKTCHEYHCESNRVLQKSAHRTQFCHDNQCNQERCGGSFGCPKLQSIPSGYQSKADLIDLSRNAITEVATGLFNNVPELCVLLLNENLITSIQRGSFSALANLETLWLFGNHIRRFPINVQSEGLCLCSL